MPASTSARRRFAIAGACVLIALYAALLWEHARTRKPWNDEAMFAHPAWNFVTTGSMGSPVFEEKGSAFPNVNRYTYYMFPLYLFTVAAWYQAVGFGLMELRALSMLWHA